MVCVCVLQLPFDGVEISWDKKFTYLDTQGRPVLVLRKSNVVPGAWCGERLIMLRLCGYVMFVLLQQTLQDT